MVLAWWREKSGFRENITMPVGKCFRSQYSYSKARAPELPRFLPLPAFIKVVSSSARWLQSPQGELDRGRTSQGRGGVKSVKGSPSCTQTHLLPAPPNALKSQSGFVVFPGGAGTLDARSIKAAAAAVAAQSPALRVRTLGPVEALRVLSLQRRQHSSAGTRRAKRHSSFLFFSLESFWDDGSGHSGCCPGLGRPGGCGSLRSPSAGSERHLELRSQLQRHQEHPADERRCRAPRLRSQRGSRDSFWGSQQVPRQTPGEKGLADRECCNGSHLGKRAQNGLCKSSSRCVWQLPLGAVSGKVLQRWAERDCEASRSAELGAQAPHPLPAPFPQPYPCAEDAECSADEYCASPPRGAGAQICQACRKLRKRCMRHAMCCPGNHCKNGESGSSLSDSNRPLLPRLQLRANPLSWEHFGTTLPMGVQRARFPGKDFRLLFNLGAKISTEVLELLISLCAPRLLKRAPYLRVDTSIRICLESLDTIWEWRWAGRWNLQRPQGHQNGHVVACSIFLTVLLTALPGSLFHDLRSSCHFERFICADHS